MSLDVYLEMDGDETIAESVVYTANITHNLNEMAYHAGLYNCMWRPEENNFKLAKDLIGPLTEGYKELTQNPDKYKKYNPWNHWGNYELLCQFTQEYLFACMKYPCAKVKVWR